MICFYLSLLFYVLFIVSHSQPSLDFQLIEVQNENSKCYDGSNASYYFRNCSANWDSHSGFDYCANITDTWVIHFSSDSLTPTNGSALGGALCYSDESCSNRNQELKSSLGLNSTAFLQGIVIPYAEVNPNLYKQHSVVIPYCSSDLWVGREEPFLGSNIVTSTILQLFNHSYIPQGMGPTMAHADRIIIIGGAGIMAQLDEINDLIISTLQYVTGNESATVPVFGICDGCLLVNITPSFIPPQCTTDKNCPPQLAIEYLSNYRSIYRPKNCHEIKTSSCYLAQSVANSLLTGDTPVLVQAQLYDQVQLLSYGINTSLNASKSEQTWAIENYAPTIRSLLQHFNYSFSAACAMPSYLTLSRGYYQLTTRFQDIYGNVHSDALDVALSSFLEDASIGGFGPSVFGSYKDICNEWLCGTCSFIR
jgi:hypothetical protein